jgi:hypothetical protein
MILKIIDLFQLTQEKRNITLKHFNPDINKGIEEYKAKTHRSLTRQRQSSTWLSSGRDAQRDAKKQDRPFIQNIDCLVKANVQESTTLCVDLCRCHCRLQKPEEGRSEVSHEVAALIKEHGSSE